VVDLEFLAVRLLRDEQTKVHGVSPGVGLRNCGKPVARSLPAHGAAKRADSLPLVERHRHQDSWMVVTSLHNAPLRLVALVAVGP
jgi:hypothetical protein